MDVVVLKKKRAYEIHQWLEFRRCSSDLDQRDRFGKPALHVGRWDAFGCLDGRDSILHFGQRRRGDVGGDRL